MEVSGQLHILGASALRKEPMAPTGKTVWSNRQRKKSWRYWEINPIIQPHSTDIVLTIILVADREETSDVLVQSTLWHGMVQQVFLTEVGILWNRKSLSIGDLTPLFPLQLNLTLCYKKSHSANLLLLRWLAPSKIFSTMEPVPKNQQLLFDYTLSVIGGGDHSHKHCTLVISINNKCKETTIHKLSTIQWIPLPVQPFVVWPMSGACITQPHIFSLFVTFQKHGIRTVYTGPNWSVLKKYKSNDFACTQCLLHLNFQIIHQ